MSFNPLWINTALKLQIVFALVDTSFNPLWINTALKHIIVFTCGFAVSIPYGLTLLSNSVREGSGVLEFQSPMD